MLAGTQGTQGGESVETTIRGLDLEDHQNSSGTRAGDVGGGCGSPGKPGSFWDGNGVGRQGLSKALSGELRWRRIWEPCLPFTPKGRQTTSVLSILDASLATGAKPSIYRLEIAQAIFQKASPSLISRVENPGQVDT